MMMNELRNKEEQERLNLKTFHFIHLQISWPVLERNEMKQKGRRSKKCQSPETATVFRKHPRQKNIHRTNCHIKLSVGRKRESVQI